MIIESSDNELIIRISKTGKFQYIQQTLDFLEYQEATSLNKASQEEIDSIVKEINTNWWVNNKNKILK